MPVLFAMQRVTMETSKFLFAQTSRIEQALGVPDGFLAEMLDESDWSVTIKASALVEASLTEHLLASLNRPELDDALRAMQTSGKVSKLSMASALGIVNDGEAQFVQNLSELRNTMVHDVKKAHLSIGGYLDSMKEPHAQTRLRKLCFLWDESQAKRGRKSPHLKEYLWLHLLAFLSGRVHGIKGTSMKTELADLQRQLREFIQVNGESPGKVEGQE